VPLDISRGSFVSYSGFSEEGLRAFGKGKRVICLDGFDMSEALQRELPLNVVLNRWVIAAASSVAVGHAVLDARQHGA
jgi:hypothetical protein